METTLQTPARVTRMHETSDVPKSESGEIERARNGDELAIAVLVDRYRARALRLAAAILRSNDEAQDVVQVAFLRAFGTLGTYRGDGAFFTWLYPIIVRTALDRRRTAWWRRRAAPLQERDAAASFENASDARILVEQLLDALDAPMRAVLVLRELEGLEYEEIAIALRIPVGRVKWRLHRARALFRELYMKEVGGPA
ncbi:MAG: sigma-70 family RNA polymerase sigma factor [Armatimonadetes bacterium]|nr:sigma-70 family RNA polymerase sigma factor [Armatimonadota bacterium]MDE2205696.1 sigma-70 family RNA polymerase sigma factor [Armatimonadota bacterium]